MLFLFLLFKIMFHTVVVGVIAFACGGGLNLLSTSQHMYKNPFNMVYDYLQATYIFIFGVLALSAGSFLLYAYTGLLFR